MTTEPWFAATDANIDTALQKLYAQYNQQIELLMLVLYKHPKDAPDFHVVRAWFIRGQQQRTGPAFGFRADGNAELWIAEAFPWLTRIERMPDDEPHIVATWI